MIEERPPDTPADDVYWWRLPDDEAALMSLRPAELKCYLVVVRAIQRDKNAGRVSVSQVSARSGVSHRHAVTALSKLVDLGLLRRDGKAGATAIYSLPYSWKGNNRFPIGNQLASDSNGNQFPVGNRFGDNSAPEGNQHRLPVGNRNQFPVGNQHLESSEVSESSPQFSVTVSNSELAEERAQPAPGVSFVDFIRNETRVEIGGRVADEGTVQLLASALGDLDTWNAFRLRFRRWCINNTPQTWGILVAIARDVAAARDQARLSTGLVAVTIPAAPAETVQARNVSAVAGETSWMRRTRWTPNTSGHRDARARVY